MTTENNMTPAWRLVPVEANEEMTKAAGNSAFGWPLHYARHYNAMLAAAPDPSKDEALVNSVAKRMCCPSGICPYIAKPERVSGCQRKSFEDDARAVIVLLTGQ